MSAARSRRRHPRQAAGAAFCHGGGAVVEAAVSIGSNVGDRAANCLEAVGRLRRVPGVSRVERSALYSTAPVGVVEQRGFINLAVSFRTSLPPRELLRVLKNIELSLGRPPAGRRWGPRVIDLDIILYGASAIVSTPLIVPHPLAHERAFVMVPLAEIAPSAVHPVFGEKVAALAARAAGRSGVKRFSP